MGERSTPVSPPLPPAPPRPPPLYRLKEHQELPGLLEAAQMADVEAKEEEEMQEGSQAVTLVEVR
jgi:hypothetical protein